ASTSMPPRADIGKRDSTRSPPRIRAGAMRGGLLSFRVRSSRTAGPVALPGVCPHRRGVTMHSQPVALVTGGSRGIGRGICLELAQLGYALAVNYAGNEEAARETQQLLGDNGESLLCQADVSAAADRGRLVETVLAQWGRI